MKIFQSFVFMLVLSLCICVMTNVAKAAEVLNFKGRVQVQSSSDSGWTPVEIGMNLEYGDTVRTARNSFVDIAMDKAKLNTIRLEQKAMIVLNSEINGNIDKIDLSKGRVYANLEGLKSGMSFEVSTPSSIAGVRGSSYSVFVKKGSDEILAIKDTVYLQAFDANKKQIKEIMVPEGFKTFVERFGAPSALIQISTEEFRHFDEIMEDISSAIDGKLQARAKQKARMKEIQKMQKFASKTPVQEVAELVEERVKMLDEIKDVHEIVEERNKIQDIIDYHDESQEEYHYESHE